MLIDTGKAISLQLLHKPCTIYTDNGSNLIFVCYTAFCPCQVQDTKLDGLIISLSNKLFSHHIYKLWHPDLIAFQVNIFLKHLHLGL